MSQQLKYVPFSTQVVTADSNGVVSSLKVESLEVDGSNSSIAVQSGAFINLQNGGTICGGTICGGTICGGTISGANINSPTINCGVFGGTICGAIICGATIYGGTMFGTIYGSGMSTLSGITLASCCGCGGSFCGTALDSGSLNCGTVNQGTVCGATLNGCTFTSGTYNQVPIVVSGNCLVLSGV